MNLLLVTIIIIKLFAYATAQYDIQPDNCEPLTYELIAGLVTKEARQLLTFTDSSSPAVSSARGTRAITLKKQQKQLKQVRFDLYTRLNPKTAQVLHTDDQLTLINSNFNNTWPVRILIHGWFGQRRICSNFAIKDAYLNIGDFNVILVDWSDYTLDINYLRVILEMLEVGKQLNSFVHFLHHSMGIQYKDVYLIGHSLGCHVAGLAGRLLRPERYGVIYALDAAGPLVKLLGKDFYLTKHDALYVESIQTDVGMFGFRSSIIGHASFLPNWGLGQPHCPNATNVPDFTCDHFGALFYFIESLYNAKAFGAIKCSDYASVVAQKCGCGRKRQCPAAAFMGGEPAVPKRGIYYLSTRPEQPFGYGEICRIKRAIDPIVIRLS